MITAGRFWLPRSSGADCRRGAHQLGVDGLDDLLRRVERLADLLADERSRRRSTKPDDLEVDVRLEQREPDLLQRRVDGLLVEPATTLDALQGGLEPLGKGIEHVRTFETSGRRG
jgi:hypothetical protein